jgi:ribokinase
MKAAFVGECTLDHIGLVEALLEAGQRREMSTFSVQGSGSAANSAVVTARLGGDVEFVGKVGSDQRGRQIERTLAEEGITTDNLVRSVDAVSQFSFRAVEHGSGRSEQLYTKGTVERLQPEETRVPSKLDLLVTDGSQPAYVTWLIETMRERGEEPRVVLNAGDAVDDLEKFIDKIDFLVAPESFASRTTGVGRLAEIGESLLGYGLEGVVLTLGQDGVYGQVDGEQVRDEGLSVEVVDPEGAQDTFAGVFAYGLLEDWSFRRCVRLGVRAGDLIKTELGSRQFVPELSDIEP